MIFALGGKPSLWTFSVENFDDGFGGATERGACGRCAAGCRANRVVADGKAIGDFLRRISLGKVLQNLLLAFGKARQLFGASTGSLRNEWTTLRANLAAHGSASLLDL